MKPNRSSNQNISRRKVALQSFSSRKSSLRFLTAGSLFLSAICAYGSTPPLVTYSTIHDFGAKVNGPLGAQQYDGSEPTGGVTFDSAGNLYGTSSTGGYTNAGNVWEITSAGVYIVLHNFGGVLTSSPTGGTNPNFQVVQDGTAVKLDGATPEGAVKFDSAGNLYGTAEYGGANNQGMVWEITKTGTYIDLHDFGGTTTVASGVSGMDGSNPVAGVTFDSSGNLYGTTYSGGSTRTAGMVWKITTAGVYSDLHDFGGTVLPGHPDGANPYAEVSFDSSGNMYGTASANGLDSGGVLWELTTAKLYKDLHDFNGAGDGRVPKAPVLVKGTTLYGTCTSHGGGSGNGSIWKYASGVFTDLHNFGNATITSSAGVAASKDSVAPEGNLVMDSAGNLYGTAYRFTATNPFLGGNIWKYSTSNVYTDLHDFGGKVYDSAGNYLNDGEFPMGGLALDQYGNLYGTASAGGALGSGAMGPGTVWTLGSLASLTVGTAPFTAGVKYTGMVTLGAAAPIGGTMIQLSSNSANAAPPSYVAIPAGATVGTFSVGTARSPSPFAATITASQTYASVSSTMSIAATQMFGFSYFNGPKGGSTATVLVDLTGPAPAAGLTITLSSNSGLVTLPASVYVTPGNVRASFTVTYGTVTTATPVTITGLDPNGYSGIANITIQP